MSLSGLRVAVIVFPGSNCDRDMMVAIEQLAGRRPSLVWHKETTLDPVDLAIIPGGFSYGDYLRCGALAARAPIMESVLAMRHAAAPSWEFATAFKSCSKRGFCPVCW